jgi:16S rRNA C967 or C1407 C5-methylase (RsmB/RsmF family)
MTELTIPQINSAIVSGKFDSLDLDVIANAIRFARSQMVQKNTGSLVIGTAVKFVNPKTGQTHTGVVKKVKVKNILIDCPSYGRGGLLNVPAHMLSAA